MARVVDLKDRLSLFSDHWSPKVVATLNDYEVKVVKVKGEFVWHSHADTDELFLVVQGTLTIRLPDGEVSLGPGQLFVVPRGVEHCPVAAEEASLVLIEPTGVVNTGEAGATSRPSTTPACSRTESPRSSSSRTQQLLRARRSSASRRRPTPRMPAARRRQAGAVPLIVADPTTRVPS